MDTSVAAVTVNVVLPEISPNVAVIVVPPTLNEVASPLKPTALLMVATPVFEEVHVTDVVRFCAGPAVNMPVAINC
jgi:ABC-type amino acid transport system permease subunit